MFGMKSAMVSAVAAAILFATAGFAGVEPVKLKVYVGPSDRGTATDPYYDGNTYANDPDLDGYYGRDGGYTSPYDRDGGTTYNDYDGYYNRDGSTYPYTDDETLREHQQAEREQLRERQQVERERAREQAQERRESQQQDRGLYFDFGK